MAEKFCRVGASEKRMRNAAEICCIMLKCRKYVQRVDGPCGNAVSAGIWLWAQRHRRFARSADIPRVILRFVKKIIKRRF